MSIEIIKIRLIEAIIKVTDSDVLSQLESVLQDSLKTTSYAHAFSGVWSKGDAELIEKAILGGCEQVNEDDWK